MYRSAGAGDSEALGAERGRAMARRLEAARRRAACGEVAGQGACRERSFASTRLIGGAATGWAGPGPAGEGGVATAGLADPACKTLAARAHALLLVVGRARRVNVRPSFLRVQARRGRALGALDSSERSVSGARDLSRSSLHSMKRGADRAACRASPARPARSGDRDLATRRRCADCLGLPSGPMREDQPPPLIRPAVAALLIRKVANAEQETSMNLASSRSRVGSSMRAWRIPLASLV